MSWIALSSRRAGMTTVRTALKPGSSWKSCSGLRLSGAAEPVRIAHETSGLLPGPKHKICSQPRNHEEPRPPKLARLPTARYHTANSPAINGHRSSRAVSRGRSSYGRRPWVPEGFKALHYGGHGTSTTWPICATYFLQLVPVGGDLSLVESTVDFCAAGSPLAAGAEGAATSALG